MDAIEFTAALAGGLTAALFFVYQDRLTAWLDWVILTLRRGRK